MKSFLQSKKGKALLLIFHVSSAVAIAVAISILILNTKISIDTSFGSYDYTIDFLESDKTFEESSYFNTILDNHLDDTIRYAVIRSQMETYGQFNGKKIVDVEAYSKRFEKENSNYVSVSYYLEDLIKWGQYGLEYAVENNNDNSYYSLIERYKSIEDKSISAYVTEELTYDELCSYLENSVNSLSYNYTQYKKYNLMFNNSESNLSYYIELYDQNGAKTVYTNLEDATNAKQNILSMGKYIFYDAEKLSYDTNTDIAEEELVISLYDYDYTYSDNCKIMIGIDTSYPYADSFYQGHENYRQIVPWVPFLFLMILTCTLITFTSLFLLFPGAGRNTKSAEVILLFLDKLVLEVFLVLSTVIVVLLALVTSIVLQELYIAEIEKNAFCIIAGIGTLITDLFFVGFLLSIVRRIKARTLLKNTIIYWCYRLIRRILHRIKIIVYHLFDDGRVATRTWIPYLLYLIINFILLSLGFIWDSLFLIAIAFSFDIIIGIYIFRENKAKQMIVKGIELIKDGDFAYKVDSINMHGDTLKLAEAVNTLGDGIHKAVESSMKDERMKTDLITNVSHDIKTPLTSIVNYVDLLKRENIEDEKIKGYIAILDSKSQRLKHLTEDLVEASKISSGNISLIMTQINFVELINQSVGEFCEKFDNRGLRIVMNLPKQPLIIEADSRRIWRVIENLCNNIAKYALENTRVYFDLNEKEENGKLIAELSIKNISSQSLNISANELTERFIRGDISRSTEGSGLGLSIAQSLTEAQNGKFTIYLDGDLFKATVSFPIFSKIIKNEVNS